MEWRSAFESVLTGSRTLVAELWRYRWITFSLALNTYVLVETNAPAWQYTAIPGCVVFAAWIGVRAAECWRDGQWGSATGASFLFAMTVLANIYVAITAAALTHDAAIGSRSAKIQRTDSITGEIKDTNDELRRQRSATAGATEGQIQAVIDRLEAHPIFREEKRSNRCANDTAAESRTLCDQWRDEKGRKAAALRIGELEARLGKLQQESWNGTAATEQMIDADPGAKATITGMSEKLITAGFTGYLAVLLELIAAFAPAFCSANLTGKGGVANLPRKPGPTRFVRRFEPGFVRLGKGRRLVRRFLNPPQT
jgi:hypothetical protein